MKFRRTKRCRNEAIKIERPFRLYKKYIKTAIETTPRNDRNANLEHPYDGDDSPDYQQQLHQSQNLPCCHTQCNTESTILEQMANGRFQEVHSRQVQVSP